MDPFEGVSESFFYANKDAGQLWLDDRKALWRIVRTLQPALSVETGTWKGGGSTFFISSALYANGGGHLYTVEDNREMVEIAVKNYDTKWSHLTPHLKMFHGDSIEVYGRVLKGKRLDFVFIDGGNNPIAEREFELLGPMVRKGGILASHDWFNGKQIEGIKTHPDWIVREIIGNGDGSFERGSVGLMIAEKIA
jgi:predicted O-methyltransferase YrrM